MKKYIRSTDEDIQLSIVHPIYKLYKIKTFDDDGNPIVGEKEKLVKEISVKRWIRKEAIISIDEYVTTKNKISKNRSIIFDKYSARFYATFHNADDLWSSVTQKHQSILQNQIGFRNEHSI